MEQIDQDLYNRQIYVIGNQAMLKLSKANILLIGLGGLGIEIAKNIVLAGVGSITILDNNICQERDISTQFFINSNHVIRKITRAEASLDQLHQLNLYVRTTICDLDVYSDAFMSTLTKYHCVVLTEIKDMSLSIRINEFCRQNRIAFLLADVYGLVGWSFSDFGDEFEVHDVDGEEYREQFIGEIKFLESNKICIQTLDKKQHNLETNDLIEFDTLKGKENNLVLDKKYSINVTSPYEFTIESKDDINCLIKTGGYFKKTKVKKLIHFKSLEEQLKKPDIMLCELSEEKFFNPYIVHLALNALYLYFQKNDELKNFNQFIELVGELKKNFEKLNGIELNYEIVLKIVRVVYLTQKSCFPPLCAFFGGLVGQEVLKSVTNKFTPITQFFNLDYLELFEPFESSLSIIDMEKIYQNLSKNDRFDNLRECFGGEVTVRQLEQFKIFMVGCGAIGCEMLKNYALLGLGSGQKGLISITDHDIIEKSNLNRQFLFRHSDIQKSKSLAAKAAVLKMNSNLNITEYEKKVSIQTEAELFNDGFFQAHDVCVNALDNVEARRYMDTRCVSNQKPLVESGTLGPKGHVQVIVPHLTESYNSQRDPMEADIPYCTLKSFPSNIEHCIQWSRDKFESNFTLKPTMFEKFQKENQDIHLLINKLKEDENLVIEGLNQFIKIIQNFCYSWSDCILLARKKFEKYFPNKAKNLLYSYPLDHLMKDGTQFWKLPKRPPQVLNFDSNNEIHLNFVRYCARMYAFMFNVSLTDTNDLNDDNKLKDFLDKMEEKVPKWWPKNKPIEIDETKKKEDSVTKNTKEMSNQNYANLLESFESKCRTVKLNIIQFEKDDEQNGHIDFIYVTSNLRAHMYGIELTDKLTAKKIAGKIIPAIATTTSCIAGLATIELVKLTQKTKGINNNEWSISQFRNVFLNLGISLILLSEPGACVKSKIAENCYVSLWDKWSIIGTKSFTLRNFIETVKQKYNLTVSGVMLGSKPIYIPVMPGHAKRLNETMLKLTKGSIGLQESLKNVYVDLFLTYDECDSDEKRDQNNLCPPIRYWFES